MHFRVKLLAFHSTFASKLRHIYFFLKQRLYSDYDRIEILDFLKLLVISFSRKTRNGKNISTNQNCSSKTQDTISFLYFYTKYKYFLQKINNFSNRSRKLCRLRYRAYLRHVNFVPSIVSAKRKRRFVVRFFFSLVHSIHGQCQLQNIYRSHAVGEIFNQRESAVLSSGLEQTPCWASLVERV